MQKRTPAHPSLPARPRGGISRQLYSFEARVTSPLFFSVVYGGLWKQRSTGGEFPSPFRKRERGIRIITTYAAGLDQFPQFSKQYLLLCVTSERAYLPSLLVVSGSASTDAATGAGRTTRLVRSAINE